MEKEPNVAIITRTKDRPVLLERAIQSVLAQTLDDWVHVIVNDGGDRGGVDHLRKKYLEKYNGRLILIHNDQPMGMEAASNIGIRSSESKFIAIHDDDDSWQPTFLDRCVSCLCENPYPSVSGVVTHMHQIFEKVEGESVTEIRRQEYDPSLAAISLPQMTEINRFLPISFVYNRDVLHTTGFYDESLPVIGDWEFNIRFLMSFDILVLRECLANYHVRLESEEEYRNSVDSRSQDHSFHRALIVNKHIRQDLEKGRLTEGQLLALGDYFYRTSSGVSRLANVLDRLKNYSLIKRFRKLTKF